MGVTATNTIVVYRDSDADSEEFADYYISARGMDASQKVSVPCSNAEILTSQTDFDNEVFNPLKAAIEAIELGGRPVHCIVLGYKVPGAWVDNNSEIMSIPSRISRIFHSYDKKRRNDLFDRKTFKRFDDNDADFAIVTARIDGPNLRTCKEMVDRASLALTRRLVTGSFYLDPYSDRNGKYSSEYEAELLDFQIRTLPRLNLDFTSTQFIDPYTDSLIPSVFNDSFIWSWFTDRTNDTFFKESSGSRTFCYNADNDAGQFIRDANLRTWTVISIRNGYMSTAGASSEPGHDAHLVPNPFFETLLLGGTIGEAFMYSVPHVNWKLTFFGDPLVQVSFPAQAGSESLNVTANSESIRLMSQDIARAIAYHYRKTNNIEQARDLIVLSNDVNASVDLLYPLNELQFRYLDERRQSEFRSISDGLLRYIEQNLYFSDWTSDNLIPSASSYLSSSGIQISELIADCSSVPSSISTGNILPSGWWQIEKEIVDEAGAFAFYNFDVQVSDKKDFSNIIFDISTLTDVDGWEYEVSKNKFVPLGIGGISSRFVGNRIRFSSPPDFYMTRGDIFFYRIRQRDQLQEYPYQIFSDIIYT